MPRKTLNLSLCASVIFCFVLVSFSCQEASCADAVSVKNGLLSVNLKETSLLDVARDIEKQSGVWFRGDETLFQEKISVTFTDLPFEEGLKRILANLNYSLMFGAKNEIAGVMVMGEGTPAAAQPGRPGAVPPRVTTPPRTTTRTTTPALRTRPSTSAPPAATVRRPPRTIPQPASQGGTGAQTPGSVATQSPLPDAFKTQDNVQPPGGPTAADGPLPPAFRVIENAPPPGGTPEGAPKSPATSKPAANVPTSPGEASKNNSAP